MSEKCGNQREVGNSVFVCQLDTGHSGGHRNMRGGYWSDVEPEDPVRAAEIAAAEERGRRRGVEEAKRSLLKKPVPQDSDGPNCEECGHERWWHQWSSKEHGFCCKPFDAGVSYCECPNYVAALAPRDSGEEG